MSKAYYNENDPFAAQWLRNLIAEGLIADGDVDDRSITDVAPQDLDGYTQCHFFAGIGGWSYALRLAGWADDVPVWTGSCPCQPFSVAGKGKGESDSRHLWPDFYRLIAERTPPTVFGEQVASKAGLGWLDGVFTDLEGSGYACGASDLCAAGLDLPHIRQRLWWVADAERERTRARIAGIEGQKGRWRHRPAVDGDACGLEQPHNNRPYGQRSSHGRAPEVAGPSAFDRLGDTNHRGPQGWRVNERRCADQLPAWPSSVVIPCKDGKSRRISAQPGDEPLAHGIPRDLGRRFPELRLLAKGARFNRVGRLRGFGNAIVPQLAAEFIKAFTEAA